MWTVSEGRTYGSRGARRSPCAISTSAGCARHAGSDRNAPATAPPDFICRSIWIRSIRDEAPGVGTPVRGGITYREAHLAMEIICDCDRMLAMEIVEVNPVLDEANRTAILGVELMMSALGKRILMRNYSSSCLRRPQRRARDLPPLRRIHHGRAGSGTVRSHRVLHLEGRKVAAAPDPAGARARIPESTSCSRCCTARSARTAPFRAARNGGLPVRQRGRARLVRAMDKEVMKRLCVQAGLPVVEYCRRPRRRSDAAENRNAHSPTRCS